MKDLYKVAGIKELDLINLYVMRALTPEERQFIGKMNKVVEECENGKGKIFGFNEQIKIQIIWQKYEHLKPFKFRFDPEKKIPDVFKNHAAFIIWTTCRSRHLRCQEDLVEEASIAAARILQKIKPPFPETIKNAAINEFLRYIHRSYPREGEIDYWEKYIFPFLEEKCEFNWQIIPQCFYCSKDAIAICDSISPTSSTGKTPERALCEDCIVSTPGVNILKWLVTKTRRRKRNPIRT